MEIMTNKLTKNTAVMLYKASKLRSIKEADEQKHYTSTFEQKRFLCPR